MAERFASIQTALQRVQPYAVAAREHSARAWAITKRWSAKAWAASKVLVGKAHRVSKRALIATLTVLEKVLLSPSGRERVHATAVFTLIFAFGVTSVDYLLSGGPEFSPSSARAAPYVSQASLISSRSPRPAAELAFAAPVETTIDEGVIEDAVVTPLSAPARAVVLVEDPKPEPAAADGEAPQRAKNKGDAA